MSTPFEILGLSENATLLEVENAWKRARSECHPDKGGTSAKFQQQRIAYLQAREIAQKPKPCMDCYNGIVTVRNGFFTTQKTCGTCHGTGKHANE